MAVEHGGARAILCVSKVDLRAGQEARDEVTTILAPYRALGLDVVECSTRRGDGVDRLRDALRARTCALVGHSGVGKSSLLHALFPEIAPIVGAVSDSSGKGRHTTSASTLYELEDGTRLIDTPGVRSFGLWDIPRAELAGYFPDFSPFVHACRFADCRHEGEPACGVRAASESGALARARYEAYLRILETL